MYFTVLFNIYGVYFEGNLRYLLFMLLLLFLLSLLKSPHGRGALPNYCLYMVDIYIVVYKFYRVYIYKLYEFCMRYSTKRKKKEYGKPKIDKEKV